jgi:UDP-N-acetylglucosamine--N-acetylmuramyl-(pentapeptide) pyrophosphoryl-undecaprenol N-acetylglucosamine transferase
MSEHQTAHGPSIVFAGGGTAGHVNPLLAIAKSVKQKDPSARITVIGTKVGLEARLVPQAGFPLETIEKVPFPRRPNMAALKFPFRWNRELKKVEAILAQQQADAVVGVGGYASAPAYRAAWKAHVPLIIHEQNARAGMANKLGARWADLIGTVYVNTGLHARDGVPVIRVGLPLRPAIAQAAQAVQKDRKAARIESCRQLGLDPNRPILLVTGGSLGAQSLNESVSGACAQILQHAQVIHLTGRGKLDEVRARVTQIVGRQHLSGLGPDQAGAGDYHAVDYFEHIELAFQCADLVVCRSGAGTVSEIAALGVPAVYVPLPIGNGEQRYNAQPVVDLGGGQIVDDSDFTIAWAQKNLVELLSDQDRLERMRQAAWKWGVRDAASTMADRVLELARQHYTARQHGDNRGNGKGAETNHD